MKHYIINVSELLVVNELAILETRSLGSCVGVILWDRTTKTAGLAHIMLPDSRLGPSVSEKTGKYADIALRKMHDEMISKGAARGSIIAKIAGGAYMFFGAEINDVLNIGARNVVAVKALLKEMGIPLLAEDCGQNYGRTIEFNVETGRVKVKSSLRGEKEI